MSKGDIHVQAQPHLLPPKWWEDEYIAAEVRNRLRSMHRDGISILEIARVTGVSSRGVQRILKRRKEFKFECGVVAQKSGEPCKNRVIEEGDKCRYHRDA